MSENLHTALDAHTEPAVLKNNSLLYVCSKTVALFCVTCVLLLQGSLWFIIPRLTTVTVHNVSYSPLELANFTSTLQAQVADLQTERRAALAPINNTAYTALVTQKIQMPDLLLWHTNLQTTVQNLQVEGKPTIAIEQEEMSHVQTKYVLTIKGVVQSPQDNALTIAARFMAELQKLPQVSKVESTTLERVLNADQKPFVPFTFTIYFS